MWGEGLVEVLHSAYTGAYTEAADGLGSMSSGLLSQTRDSVWGELVGTAFRSS